MTLKEMLILLTPPEGLARVRALSLTPAHRLWRLGAGGRLMRLGAGTPRRGLLAVDDCGFDGRGDPAATCRQIVRECENFGLGGVVCLFKGGGSPLSGQLAEQLDATLARRGLSLYVPEWFGTRTVRARVMISSALSGGSLEARLDECARRFGGAERLALFVEPVAELFLLPAPTGGGRALTSRELDGYRRRYGGSVFFSEELCERYFTYMTADGGARFVLYDDGATVRKKLLLARQLGIRRALGHFKALNGMLEEAVTE